LARDTRVRWALEEAGQSYDVRPVSFAAMKEPAYWVRHPFGQIPTHEDGDLTLLESGAIVLHIAETHAGLLPENPAAQELDAATFLAPDHVVMRPPSPGQTFAERELHAIGIRPNVVVSTFSFMTLPDLVRGSKGVALVDPPMDLPPLMQSAQWHATRSHDPALDWLRLMLHATAAEQTETQAG
jgi:DNA-binding transcriptional LysR family regulator